VRSQQPQPLLRPVRLSAPGSAIELGHSRWSAEQIEPPAPPRRLVFQLAALGDWPAASVPPLAETRPITAPRCCRAAIHHVQSPSSRKRTTTRRLGRIGLASLRKWLALGFPARRSDFAFAGEFHVGAGAGDSPPGACRTSWAASLAPSAAARAKRRRALAITAWPLLSSIKAVRRAQAARQGFTGCGALEGALAGHNGPRRCPAIKSPLIQPAKQNGAGCAMAFSEDWPRGFERINACRSRTPDGFPFLFLPGTKAPGEETNAGETDH